MATSFPGLLAFLISRLGKWTWHLLYNVCIINILGNTVDRKKLTVPYAVDQWIKGGFPAFKIALGMGMYGRGFKLKSANDHGLGALKAVSSRPNSGMFTREAGFLSYYEICGTRFTIVKDNVIKAPYGYMNLDWVGFDDQESLKYKVESQIKGKISYVKLVITIDNKTETKNIALICHIRVM